MDMKYDLLLKNGILVTSHGSFAADVAVKDGKIALIAAPGSSAGGSAVDEVSDVRGKFILPGVIDAHVHFREPGLTAKEDFETGSRAAACGGVTMAADMPNTLPVTAAAGDFAGKVRLAEEKSCIDFGLFALLTHENSGEMDALHEMGALGFKIFLGTSTGDIAAPGEGVMFGQMEQIARLKTRIGFHAENSALNEYCTRRCREGPRRDEPDILTRARPDFSEAEAVARAIRFSEYTGAKIHIYHLSAARSVDLVRDAKRRGLLVSAETCPHYLLFNAGDYPRLGGRMKVYPPIRGPEDQAALWEGIADGTIDMIASDHAPHTAAEKEKSLWEASSGLSGVETSVRLMLNEVNRGRLSLNDYVRLSSEAPARIWHIYPQKGSLRIGADGDFTIVDMEKTGIIRNDRLHSKNRTGIYDGLETRGMPVATIVRGRFVMKDGELTGAGGFGRLVKPRLIYTPIDKIFPFR
jgi:dihydroorotase